ncbi:hypothetical protein FOZ63_028323 [Perkinsus olseni]|uniref:Uncharacterized protein n=1 Tax=Perkinsus olseni TaxID=32597 RepID=A0A7J6SGF5_PEROL|nr:hypothetical protein FOZ63_028323 [Perkinsus olseni]KAF4731978.1 hypothetical protein FOZ62_024858 [Perkinsus olseni]
MLSALSAGINPEVLSVVRRYAPRAVEGGAVLLASLCVAKLIETLIKSLKPVPFPGPKGVPFFGMALELDQERALACMRVWNKQYGKTIGFRYNEVWVYHFSLESSPTCCPSTDYFSGAPQL